MFELVRVESPYFVAGAEYCGDRCVRAAPIIRYFLRMPRSRARAYARRKRWKWLVIDS